ncbi:MAG: HNH endonuclease [Planctomycetes bacterium]|nr:HNH endonuclease [Planctomycetota bacterium]
MTGAPEEWGRGDQRRLSTRDFPAEVLALVERKQGGRFCLDCRREGLQTPPDEPLEVDHLQPLARGGDNNWRNLAWRCRSHNLAKGARARPSPQAAKLPAWARRTRP